MSLLLYCVTAKLDSPPTGTGVAGLPLLSVERGELSVIFSEGTLPSSWTGSSLKDSAREFHQVLLRVFQSRNLIPFRFPTVMRDGEQLAAHLRENSPEYLVQLRKFSNAAQMDISIAYSAHTSTTSQSSGTAYLRHREKQSEELDKIAEMLRAQVAHTIADWRTRPVQKGLKVFALLDRDSVAAFRNGLQNLAVPPDMEIRVNGPWPVSEFLELAQPR